MCSVTNNVQEIIFSYISSKIPRFCLVSHEFPLEEKTFSLGRENITKAGEYEQCGQNRAHVKIVGGVPGSIQWMNHEYFECQSRMQGNLEFGFELETWFVMISLVGLPPGRFAPHPWPSSQSIIWLLFHGRKDR